MQIKKDEVRNALLEAAETEFMNKGFEHASVRQIAKAAGTTLGNFYNYFKNKEALFEALVASEYKLFIEFFTQHDTLERPDYLWDITDISQWRIVLSEFIMKILPSFSQRFILLMECSDGTQYQGVRGKLMQLLKEHFIEHMERFKPEEANTAFAEIIAEQVLSGFILILRKFRNEEERKRFMTEYLLLYFIGSMGLMGDWKTIHAEDIAKAIKPVNITN